jgi:YceI-like protein
MRIRFLLFFIIALISICNLEAQTLKVDSTKCVVKWKGTSQIDGHNGAIAVNVGFLVLEKGQIIGGEIIFNMKAISFFDVDDVDDVDEKAHMLKEISDNKFLDVSKYPTAKFRIQEVLNDTLKGELTLKGIAHPLHCGVSYTYKKKKLIIDADNFIVDLQKWGLKFTRWFKGIALEKVLSFQVHIETK